MTLYVDSSAMTKRYVDEPGSDDVVDAMAHAARIATARHTIVETGRAISRALTSIDARAARRQFEADLQYVEIVELDRDTCATALDIAVETGCRTLDALHLGAMWRLGGDDARLLTRDERQARAAIDVGLPLHPASVLG